MSKIMKFWWRSLSGKWWNRVEAMTTTSDINLLRRKLGATDYNPDLYVREISTRCVGGHELLQQRKNIQVRRGRLTSVFFVYVRNVIILCISDHLRGHPFASEEECLPELRPVYRDGERDLFPRVGDVPTQSHDHRAEEYPANALRDLDLGR